jgi:hypothetical protein
MAANCNRAGEIFMSDAFVGTWLLAGIDMQGEDGQWGPAPMAGRPLGMVTYDANGNMAIQITTDPPSSETNRAAFEFQHGYLAYFGSYEVDEAAMQVTHYRTAQNYVADGSGDTRRYELEGDKLTLIIEASLNFRLRWQREG